MPVNWPQMVSMARRARLLVVVLALAGSALAGLWPQVRAAPIEGRATAVDGDTLRLAGNRIRLLGLDAPELGQSCTSASGAPWRCGVRARKAMIDLIGNAETVCIPHGRDVYHRILAVCTARDTDLGRAMVRDGFAVAAGRYGPDQNAAKVAGAGIWAGHFELPRAWRAAHGPARERAEPQNLWERFRAWLG